MLDQVLSAFSINPDFDLDLMSKNQTLSTITQKILDGMDDVLNKLNPDLVLVHGDTTTTLAVSLSCFYKKIDIGHVEAGLRTFDIHSPWPEEFNRQLTTKVARFHFAPTQLSKQNLIAENIPESNILITGNTIIDTLKLSLKNIDEKIYSEHFLKNYDRIEIINICFDYWPQKGKFWGWIC